jgi:hypothetical protein
MLLLGYETEAEISGARGMNPCKILVLQLEVLGDLRFSVHGITGESPVAIHIYCFSKL